MEIKMEFILNLCRKEAWAGQHSSEGRHYGGAAERALNFQQKERKRTTTKKTLKICIIDRNHIHSKLC